ncbi:MAG TPA: XdhC/CoxI family protein [Dehalococcoidia bacterium]|nr:XdhC/CoxI family protein [Dehalococcoidia bacterium]
MNDFSREITAEQIRAGRGGDPVVVATIVDAPEGAVPARGTKLLLRRDGSRLGSLGGGAFEDAVAEDCLAALTEFPRRFTQAMYYRPQGSRIHRLEAKGGADAYEVMVEITEAPATLLIVGGGHISLSLATIGAHIGFSVAVLDDREMYANAERFPMADKVMCGDFTQELKGFPIGPTTYIVLVSRGHKQDETGLRAVLGRGAAYVGMIGSRRRVSTVLRHLYEEGFDQGDLEAVYTPIGFDLAAETPEEIAVSIVAEIVAVRRGGTGRPMREDRPNFMTAQPAPGDEETTNPVRG